MQQHAKNPLRKISRRQWLVSALSFISAWLASPVLAQIKYRRVRTQYIAALAPADASSGSGAETWGIWRVDPGPIGVWLRLYQVLRKAGNIAPAGWRFDLDDWWLDENGLIMKAPEFPISPGRYMVTNGEKNASILTIDPPDQNGNQNWSLDFDMTIGDVTHGPCRSARYTPVGESGTCTPENADQSLFPLELGRQLPQVKDCNRKIYAVLIVFGFPVED